MNCQPTYQLSWAKCIRSVPTSEFNSIAVISDIISSLQKICNLTPVHCIRVSFFHLFLGTLFRTWIFHIWGCCINFFVGIPNRRLGVVRSCFASLKRSQLLLVVVIKHKIKMGCTWTLAPHKSFGWYNTAAAALLIHQRWPSHAALTAARRVSRSA